MSASINAKWPRPHHKPCDVKPK